MEIMIEEQTIGTMEEIIEPNPFYVPAEIDTVIEAVANNFFIIVAVLVALYPFMYMFERLIRYCSDAFDLHAIREMEGGGLWKRLPDGSLYSGLEKLATVRLGKKWRL